MNFHNVDASGGTEVLFRVFKMLFMYMCDIVKTFGYSSSYGFVTIDTPAVFMQFMEASAVCSGTCQNREVMK